MIYGTLAPLKCYFHAFVFPRVIESCCKFLPFFFLARNVQIKIGMNFFGSNSSPVLPEGYRRVTSADYLKDVQFFIFANANGFIGSFIGRNLKFRMDRFTVDYYRDKVTGETKLSKVVCSTNSLLAMTEVDKNYFDRVPLTYAECIKVDRRTTRDILECDRYPHIIYEVQSETATETVGTLSLHGNSQLVKCTKTFEGPELIFRCPIVQSQFGIRPFSFMFGAIGVVDKVDIQVRVPTKLL